jgi:hypothetical protein
MRTTKPILVALTLSISAVTTSAQQPSLTRAKQLYEQASYIEALAVLKQDSDAGDVVELQKYRALCYLALDAPGEAEQALEQLAVTRPFLTLDADEVSPRLVKLFDEVKKRTVAAAAKQIYQRARSSFDSGDLQTAAADFRDVVRLADSAPADQAELMAELKMLATGFVRLAEAPAKPAVEATSPTPAAPREPIAPAPSTVEHVATPSAAPLDMIFDSTQSHVIPPVPIHRVMAAWPELSSTWRSTYKGLLEIVVGENGLVIAANMSESVHPTYDVRVLAATKTWSFRPATENGRPVKYRLKYPIEILPARR